MLQANAVRELADRGVSAKDAVQHVLTRASKGNERRAAEQPKEPNVGELTQEEIDAMMGGDES